MSEPAAVPVAVATPSIAHGRAWRSSLRWFLAEFVVVVAGVLVALMLNGWAQERQDGQREQAYLRQLHADLIASERDLGEAEEFLDRRAAASARVLHRFWRDEVVVDDSLIEDLSLPRSTRRFRPVLGTAEALISSGQINLIRSDALRGAILGYVESMKTQLEDINRYDETYYRPAVTRLYQGPDLYQYVRFASPDERLLPRPLTVERVPFPAPLAGMLRDRSVYDGYNSLLVAHRNQSQCYADMRERSRTLRAQIQAALDD
jgi:hypothetical protein